MTATGTPFYRAPELFARKPQYDAKVDVFSFGVMMLEVVFLTMIPGTRDRVAPSMLTELDGMSARSLEHLRAVGGSAVADLLRLCVSENPASRPTAAECLLQLDSPSVHAFVGTTPAAVGPSPSPGAGWAAASSQVASPLGVLSPTAPVPGVSSEYHSGAAPVTYQPADVINALLELQLDAVFDKLDLDTFSTQPAFTKATRLPLLPPRRSPRCGS